MRDKLIAIEKRFGELEAKLQDPESYQDPELLRRLTREQKELEPVARQYRALQKLEEELRADEELLRTEEDPELRSLLKEELESGREKLSALEEEPAFSHFVRCSQSYLVNCAFITAIGQESFTPIKFWGILVIVAGVTFSQLRIKNTN